MKLFIRAKNNTAPKHKTRDRWSNVGHDPFLDWVLILISATVIGILLIVTGVYAYIRAGNSLSRPPSTTDAAKASAIDPGMLDHILGQFDTRARERADLLKNYTGPGDPSL